MDIEFINIVSMFKPEITVATILERTGRFLLVEEETEQGILLNQPAGHLEADESIQDAAVRETLERNPRARSFPMRLSAFIFCNIPLPETGKFLFCVLHFPGELYQECDQPLELTRHIAYGMDDLRGDRRQSSPASKQAGSAVN